MEKKNQAVFRATYHTKRSKTCNFLEYFNTRKESIETRSETLLQLQNVHLIPKPYPFILNASALLIPNNLKKTFLIFWETDFFEKKLICQEEVSELKNKKKSL